MTTTPKELGNIFKRARENLNLSVDEVCEKTRMHPTVVKDIENGVFDRLGKLYIKGFLKKYSTLLSLDYANILQKYESVDAITPAPEFEFTLKPGRRGTMLRNLLAPSRKKLQVALVSVLSVVLIALVVVFVGMVKSRLQAALQKQPVPAAAVHSNYFAEVDSEKCVGCETCLDRCQMEAIDIIDDIATIDLDRCIGCGLCVTTCSTEALRLTRKSEDHLYAPPKTGAETYIQIAIERGKNLISKP